MTKHILWWGKGDPTYSRNGVVRTLLRDLGHKITNFRPKSPFKKAPKELMTDIDIIWVPCFRQRDITSAKRAAKKYNKPLVFDPLISAYDKQVFERKKFPETSFKAKRLLRKESKQFNMANIVVADTAAHANYFVSQFGVDKNRVQVLAVGAEEKLFFPKEKVPSKNNIEALFYGSFINLQGPEFIVEAARQCNDPNITWTLLGNGPLLDACKQKAKNNPNIRFENWTDYSKLADRIHKADVLLGIFGTSNKASRVIPNKAYQALACGKPLVTIGSEAYPQDLLSASDTGIRFITPGNHLELITQVKKLSEENLNEVGQQAYNSYQTYFAMDKVKEQLNTIINQALKSN